MFISIFSGNKEVISNFLKVSNIVAYILVVVGIFYMLIVNFIHSYYSKCYLLTDIKDREIIISRFIMLTVFSCLICLICLIEVSILDFVISKINVSARNSLTSQELLFSLYKRKITSWLFPLSVAAASAHLYALELIILAITRGINNKYKMTAILFFVMIFIFISQIFIIRNISMFHTNLDLNYLYSNIGSCIPLNSIADIFNIDNFRNTFILSVPILNIVFIIYEAVFIFIAILCNKIYVGGRK